VATLSAMRCHGLSTVWLTTSAVLPPAAAVTWQPGWNCVDRLLPSNQDGPRLTVRPPVPPPRFHSA
jgi:hypothetical protein